MKMADRKGKKGDENATRKAGSHGVVKLTDQIPKGPKPGQIRYQGNMKTL